MITPVLIRHVRRNLATIGLLVFVVALGLRIELCIAEEPAPLPADHAARMTKGLELFRQEVGGLLQQHCIKCHGGENTKGEFDLTTREGLLKGGELGRDVVPFKAKESTLYKLITQADEPKMPDKGPKLPEAAIAKIAEWIDDGAPYDQPLVSGKQPQRKSSEVTAADKQWWSFQPLAKVAPPPIDDRELTAKVRNDVDRFVVHKAAAQKLALSPEADKRTLIRRAYLDLLGLPPTPAEVQAFVDDTSLDAWPKLIDSLLANPHYGERWARHWLDVARFAESSGFEHDYDRPGAWVYRDFVIKALNADMPYDQFIHWQLAGDEFAPDNPLALSATGFLGAGVFPTQITANEVERTRYDALDDMLSTTSSAFLGLTVGCARCHDHKYDPIPTADYYRLLSTFTTTVRSNFDVDLDPDKSRPQREKWQSERAALIAELKQYEATLRPKFAQWLQTRQSATAAPTWTLLELSSIKSQAGATFKRLEDGSYLAESTNAAHDRYTLTANTTARQITGLRLETLAHPSMVKGGPGRAANGNFGLSKITVTATPTGGTPVPVKIAKAEATFEQNKAGLSIAAALDDNPSTGWAVDPQFGKDHAAVFTFAEPLDFAAGCQLTVTLDFQVNDQHNIGRPRLAIISGVAPRLDAETFPSKIAELLQSDSSKLTAEQQDTLFDWWKRSDPSWQAQQKKVTDFESHEPKSTTKILICGEGYTPLRYHTQGVDFFNESYILERGNLDRKVGVAAQSFLQILMPSADSASKWQWQPPPGAKYSGRRRSLANWITDVDHGAGGLAARVMVNRLWQHHFGTGLVASANDFGHTGAKPSQPELLDWLAGELIRNGWKLKPLHKLLMTSAVYMQSSAIDERTLAKEAADPANELWVRRMPRRLEAEPIRDSMLAIGGKLDETMYGPGTQDEKSPRRSIYFTMKRSQLIGSMVVFDQPEPLVSQGSRPTTTVAPQALLLMNSPQARGWAEGFATRVDQAAPIASDFKPAVDEAYRMALGRVPTDAERVAALAFLDAQTAAYTKDSRPNARSLALADFCQVLFGLNEFAYEE